MLNTNNQYVIKVNNKYFVCKSDSPFIDHKIITTNDIEKATQFKTKKDVKRMMYVLKNVVQNNLKIKFTKA